MKLSDIISAEDVTGRAGCVDAALSSLTFDSREVGPGACFFAIKGTSCDGHDFIPDAVAAGAAAIVCERLPENPDPKTAWVAVGDASQVLGSAASAWHGHPSRKLRLVGVTGTNGKTTVATLLHDLFTRLGYKAGLVSTVVYRTFSRELPSTHTTPDPLRTNAMLAEMADEGCEFCFMEVSSHSIVQNRIRGLRFAGGIFTNITHDHLDYHGTFAEYIRAKKHFFDLLPPKAFALTDADDRNGQVMVQNTRAQVSTFAMKRDADFRCRVLEMHPEGMLLEMDGSQLWVRFLGRFNASNLTAVYAAARLLGAEKGETLTALSELSPVRGRLEFVRSADGITAVIDYAHTPDALGNVLSTLAEICPPGRRIITVVGCGGDRDASKRPEMARIAASESSLAVFTQDNPRTEDPDEILRQMTAGAEGAGKYIVVRDRAEAIRTAVILAEPGDIVLVAGKGHETYQITGTEKRHFDDREQVAACMNPNN